MAENVKLEIECKEKVAKEIADLISAKEEMYNDAANYRKRYLDLYAECIYAVYGHRELDE